MKPFTESLRYDYPELTEDSWVVDVGAYLGNFSRDIAAKYKCNVLGFEPVPQFWEQAIKNQGSKTEIIPVGLGERFRVGEFRIRGDSTGEFLESDIVQLCPVIPVDALLRFVKIDLLKLNCEGAEHEILERILQDGTYYLFDNIQVQFHDVVANGNIRRDDIRKQLSLTHFLTFENGITWQNWKRR